MDIGHANLTKFRADHMQHSDQGVSKELMTVGPNQRLFRGKSKSQVAKASATDRYWLGTSPDFRWTGTFRSRDIIKWAC